MVACAQVVTNTSAASRALSSSSSSGNGRGMAADTQPATFDDGRQSMEAAAAAGEGRAQRLESEGVAAPAAATPLAPTSAAAAAAKGAAAAAGAAAAVAAAGTAAATAAGAAAAGQALSGVGALPLLFRARGEAQAAAGKLAQALLLSRCAALRGCSGAARVRALQALSAAGAAKGPEGALLASQLLSASLRMAQVRCTEVVREARGRKGSDCRGRCGLPASGLPEVQQASCLGKLTSTTTKRICQQPCPAAIAAGCYCVAATAACVSIVVVGCPALQNETNCLPLSLREMTVEKPRSSACAKKQTSRACLIAAAAACLSQCCNSVAHCLSHVCLPICTAHTHRPPLLLC